MKITAYILALVFTSQVLAQTETTISEGDFNLKHRFYKEAVELYKLAIEDSTISIEQRVHINTQLAFSYYKLFDYENSCRAYENIVNDSIQENPNAWLEYGHILRNLERYNEAINAYQKFARNTGKTTLIDYYELICNWALDHDSIAPYDLHQTDIETGGRSLGVEFYKQGIIYSKPENNDYLENTVFYDMCYAEKTTDSTFIQDKALQGDLNHSFYEGAPSLTSDSSTLYFTGNASDRSVYKERNRKKKQMHISSKGINILKIYATIETDSGWSLRKALNFCSDEFSCTHPSISADGKTIYFVSNMPGGFGGYDVYKSEYQDSLWGQPMNMGPQINTDKDEMTPYILKNELFFSTKGNLGFGGADIFKATLENEKILSVQNLGKPFNSSKDDFAFKLFHDHEHGYLSSNRAGTHGYDHIYYFEKQEVIYPDTIIGIAKNRITGEPIIGVKVTVEPDTQVSIDVKETDKGGEITLILPKNKEYLVTFYAKGFEPKEITVPAENRENIIALFGEIELIPEAKKDDIITIENIYFDYDKSTIRDESIPVLEKIKEYLLFHKDIKVELSAHTDARGSDSYNKKLSQRRAESTVNWLIENGIPPERMNPVGYGESKLVNHCKNGVKCSDEEHMKNRRVELKVL